jgi:hypothetical protein
MRRGESGDITKALSSEIAFLLDRSGSMGNYTEEAINGFNDFISDQKKVGGDAMLTLCLFDDTISHPVNGEDLKKVKKLDRSSYNIGGQTALLDAIGKTMGEMMARHSEHGHPAHVVVVILTDGYENASHEYKAPVIREMIQRAKAVYSWEFIIIGVGVNAENIAEEIGIDEKCALPESGTRQGVKRAFAEITRTVAHFRKTGDVKLLKAKN